MPAKTEKRRAGLMGGLYCRLRGALRERPLLYRAWHAVEVVGFQRARFLPNSRTRLMIEAFASSGNTFAVRLAERALGKGSIASHSHAPAAVEIGCRAGLPVMILLRRPEQAIPSSIARGEARLSQRPMRLRIVERLALEEYLSLYRSVEARLDSLQLVAFDDLIDGPEHFVALVARLGGQALSPEECRSIADEEQKRIHADRTSQMHEEAPVGVGWRTEAKEARKAEILDTLSRTDAFQNCCSAYRRLRPSILALGRAADN